MELIKLCRAICRRKRLFLQIILVVLLVPLIATFLTRPVYHNKAKIWVNFQNIKPQFISKDWPSNLGKLRYSSSDNLPDTFVYLIESRPVAEKVIKKLGLKKDDGTPLDAYHFIEPGYIQKALSQKVGMEVEQIEDSDLFEIRSYSDNAQTATDIANTVVDEFVKLFYDLNRSAATKSVNYLEKKIPKVTTEWKIAEKKRSSFAADKNILDLDTQKSDLLSALASLKSKKRDVQRDIIKNRSNLAASKKALSKQAEFKLYQKSLEYSPFLKNYKNNLYDLEVSLAAIRVELTEKHPNVKALLKKIELTKEQIKKAAKKSFGAEITQRNSYYDSLIQHYSDSEINLVVSAAEEKTIDIQIKRLEEESNALMEKDFMYTKLKMESDNLKALLTSLKSQLGNALLAKDLDLSNVFIIDRAPDIIGSAMKSSVYFPNRPLIVIVSLFLGSILALGAVLFLEYTDDSFKSQNDVTDTLKVPVLVNIPMLAKQKSEFTARGIPTAFIEKSHALHSSILQSSTGMMPKTISVVSTKRCEGKTTIAAALALSIAKSGSKVALLDANMRSPFLHKFFSLPSEPGLTDVLKGKVRLAETLRDVDGVSLVPAGTSTKDPFPLITSDRFKNILNELSEQFNVVILDTPCLEEFADGISISKGADYTIYVITCSAVTKESVLKSIAPLEDKKIGVAFNMSGKNKCIL